MVRELDVAIITTIHPPFDGRIYDRGLATLVQSGLSVCLISPWQKPDQPWLKHQWVRLPSPKLRGERLWSSALTLMAAWKQPARAYYFHDIDFLIGAVILKVLKGRPVVYDCHENYPEEILYNKDWIPPFWRPLLSQFTRRIENWAVKKLGFCVAVVPHQVERFSRLGVQTVLVQNFPSWPPRPDLRHEPALIYSGSVSPSYGAFVLLDIAREIKRRSLGIPLLVVDRFASAKLKRHFETAIRREDLPLVIHPRVKAKEMDLLLGRACLGLSTDQDSPEKRLALPTKLFEYMALGLPIIASDLPNTRRIIEKAKCGMVVTPHKASAYVDAAVNLLNSPEQFRAFQTNGFEAVATQFHWRFEQKKLSEFFQRLLARTRPRPQKANKNGVFLL